jgi:hypothetical protein
MLFLCLSITKSPKPRDTIPLISDTAVHASKMKGVGGEEKGIGRVLFYRIIDWGEEILRLEQCFGSGSARIQNFFSMFVSPSEMGNFVSVK